jgi:hypothetical protein
MTQGSDPVRIFVSRAGNSAQLRLRDNRNNPESPNPPNNPANIQTDVGAGEEIIWELDPRSTSKPAEPGYFPIGSLVGVRQTSSADNPQYNGSVSVLSKNPVKQADGTIIGSVPSPSAGKGHFTNYEITFTLPDGSQHTEDPKILLNS